MNKKLAVPRILWAALFFSTLIYVAVLELATGVTEPRWGFLLLPLSIAGASTGAASLLVPRIMLRRHRSSRGRSEPSSAGGAGAYLVTLIVGLALAESVAIFGLVLGLQGAPPRVVMPFFAATWVLMLIRFPTQARMDEFQSEH